MINQATLDEAEIIWGKAARKNSIRAPFYELAWHDTWYQTFHAKPFIFIVDDIIAPFTRHENAVTFSGGDEIADYLDVIGPDDQKLHAWRQIVPQLKKHGITQITLRNIPENSTTVNFFQAQQATVTQEDTTPHLTLAPSWDAYKASLDHKYRHELERKLRKFEREHPDAEIVESTDPHHDIQYLFDLMEKDTEKKAFLTSEIKTFFRAITQSFSKNVSLLFVTLGDKKIAATYSFVYENSYYLYNSGFDKDCCPNAGFYLKAESLKRAIEQGLREYNFLQGSERYKYELGAKDFAVYTITCHI